MSTVLRALTKAAMIAVIGKWMIIVFRLRADVQMLCHAASDVQSTKLHSNCKQKKYETLLDDVRENHQR